MALDFFAKQPGGLSWTRGPSSRSRLGPAGASTSPESGVAVSTDAKSLSRGKREIWLIFWYRVYLRGKWTTTNRRGTKILTISRVFLLTGFSHPSILQLQIRGMWKRQIWLIF